MSYFWERPNILEANSSHFNFNSIQEKTNRSREYLQRECWLELLSLIQKLNPNKLDLNLDSPQVSLGASADLNQEEHEQVSEIIKQLIPWRKGPIEVAGQFIDSEWRSDMKWERLAPHLAGIEGQRVADVGCGNGYYMYKALEFNPRFILGFDPSEKFFLAFEFLQKFAQAENLQQEILGLEDLSDFEGFFNTILCLGVLYHQRNPIQALQILKKALRPRGLLVMEGQIIPGEEPHALFPPDRYAKARNVFFVPTVSCLEAWLHRVGFEDIEVVSVAKTSYEEQRKTPFSPSESLEDFLDKDDPSKTIEGFPAPERAIILARNRR